MNIPRSAQAAIDAARTEGRVHDGPGVRLPEPSPELLAALTEAEFQTLVIDYAQKHGWLVHHQRPAKTAKGWRSAIQGDAGWPDLVLCRPQTETCPSLLIYAELKSIAGRCSEEQFRWLEALERSGQKVFVWRPDDWTTIQRTLE